MLHGFSTQEPCIAMAGGPVNLDWDQAAMVLDREQRALESADKQMRLRSEGLTPMEIRTLRDPDVWQGDAQCLADIEKLVGVFGQAHGGNAACRRLLKFCQGKDPMIHGQVAQWDSVVAILGKHLLLAQRRAQLRLQMPLPQHITECKCFSKTYIMGNGCLHKKVPLWKTNYNQSLCVTCSVCMRCGKLLG